LGHGLTKEPLLRGRQSTVDLLIKVASFVNEVKIFSIYKAASTRRPIVLSLPLHLGFPALTIDFSIGKNLKYSSCHETIEKVRVYAKIPFTTVNNIVAQRASAPLW
jgi:hypothetical protein